MAVYSEIFSDKEILNLVTEKHNDILIVGCGGCTNEALAYKLNVPIYVNNLGENNFDDMHPYATEKEMLRIKELLSNLGKNVLTKVVPLLRGNLCIQSVDKEFDLLDGLPFKPDMILVLACKAGFCGIKTKSRFDIPIYNIMRYSGQLMYFYKDCKGKRIIDKTLSKIL